VTEGCLFDILRKLIISSTRYELTHSQSVSEICCPVEDRCHQGKEKWLQGLPAARDIDLGSV